MSDPPSRRRVLELTGVTATVGLAGCTGGILGSDNTDESCTDAAIAVETPDGSTRCVGPVESDGSAADYYGHNTENQYSSAFPDDLETGDATVTFVHRNGSTSERSLVVVHDEPSDSTTGAASMAFDGVAGAEWLVRDDPEGINPPDSYETDDGALEDSESVVWQWGSNPRTDGGAFGPLGTGFDIDITHRQSGTVDGVSAERTGLDRWLFVDGNDLENPIELVSFDDGDTGDVSVRVSATDEA